MVQITIGTEEAGMRLDRYLRRSLSHVPLSQIFRFIRTGKVKVGGRRSSQDYRLQIGEELTILIDPAEIASSGETDEQQVLTQLARTEFFKRNFRILFEDDVIIACDKPPGIVVHPGSGHTNHDTLIDLARAHVLSRHGSSSQNPEPDLVHRIDKDTSGIVLIAKNKQALRILHESLRNHAISKQYVLMCHGTPPKSKGTIHLDLARTFEPNNGTKVAVVDQGGGDNSETRYKVEQRCGGISYVAAEILTGRTHQIRVHMAHIGCPIVGDVRYGDPQLDEALFRRLSAQKRLYLHAQKLSFPHPISNEMLRVQSPVPDAFTILRNASKGE